MNYKAYLVESGKRMLHKGLTVETWGNISLRDPETGLIYLTPSAMPYDTLTEEDVVVMRPDGTVAEGHRKPTIEVGMHLGLLNARPDINAVIHTHPIYSLRSLPACASPSPPLSTRRPRPWAAPCTPRSTPCPARRSWPGTW